MSVGRDLVTMQDFIVGRLSDAECRAFEDRLLREPALVRELEQSVRMAAGLAQLRGEGQLRNTGDRQRLHPAWRPLLAAAAVAGIALFLALSRVGEPTDILLASAAPPTASAVRPLVGAHFTFIAMRSGATPDLDLPAAGLIEIRAESDTHRSGELYDITLLRQEAAASVKPVASVSGLAAGADGYVHCYAVASRLAPGKYVLRIQPHRGGQEAAESFPFNLRAGAPAPP